MKKQLSLFMNKPLFKFNMLKSNYNIFNFNIKNFSEKQDTKPKAATTLKPGEVNKYIPYETLTKEEKRLFRQEQLKELYKEYGHNKNLVYRHQYMPIWEEYSKKRRQGYLNTNLVYLSKDFEIQVLRHRKATDNINDLFRQGLMPIRIFGREDFAELNLVVKRGDIEKTTSIKCFTSYFYKFHLPDGTSFRATVDDVKFNAYQTGAIKAYFHRFINGLPNIMHFPIKLSGFAENHYINECECETKTTVEDIKCWFFSEDIPRILEIDCSDITPQDKFNLKEFIDRYLPLWLIPHKDVEPRLNDTILKIYENENTFAATREYAFEAPELKPKSTEDENNVNKKKGKYSKIPYLRASSKIITATKDQGSTREAIEGVLKDKAIKRMNRDKKKKKDD